MPACYVVKYSLNTDLSHHFNTPGHNLSILTVTIKKVRKNALWESPIGIASFEKNCPENALNFQETLQDRSEVYTNA